MTDTANQPGSTGERFDSESSTSRDRAASIALASVRADRLACCLVFAVTLAVYLATCCRAIYTGDDGDFVSGLATLGIVHPTGYPLFTLLGHFWILSTPFLGSVPFRLNILTVLIGACGAAMFCRFLCDLLDGYPWRRVWAVTGALLFAFAPTYWQQSLSVEVYAPNILFLSAVLYVSLGWIRMKPGDAADRRLCLLAILYGFALTNHMMMGLFFPGFMALAIWRKPTLFGRDWPVLLPVIGCILLPLSLYIYLPMAAKYSHSPSKWGYPSEGPSFWAHITGVQYQDRMFHTHAEFVDGFRFFALDYLPAEFDGLPLLIVAAIGLGILIARRETRPISLVMAYIFVANVLFASGYHFTDDYVHFISAYLVLAASIATTGAVITGYAAKYFRWTSGDEARYVRLALPVLAAGILAHLSLHYADSDESGNYVEDDFARCVLHACPPHAVLAVRSPVALTLLYRQTVLHDRLDVLLISQDAFPGAFGANRWYLHYITAHQPDFEKYLPANTDAADVNDGVVLAETLQNFMRAGRPIIVLPLPDLDQAMKTRAEQQRKSGQEVDLTAPWSVQEGHLSDLFDRVPWGLTQRLYPKGQEPGAAQIVSDLAPVWSGASPAIDPHWDSVKRYEGSDLQQTTMFFTLWESLVAWGKEAEAGHRPDLALAAYTQALQMYSDPQVIDAQSRCTRETSGATTGSPSPAPAK